MPEGIDAIGNDAFAGCESLTRLTIPNTVKHIDHNAFHGCAFTSIVIPESVTQLGTAVLSGCSQLKSVTMPKLREIVEATFKDCTGLEEFVVEDGVSTIRPYAFEGCTNLRSVSLPSSLSYIDYDAFKDCKSLNDVYYNRKALPKISPWSDIFRGSYIGYATLHVPVSAIEEYRQTKPWSEFGSIVALP